MMAVSDDSLLLLYLTDGEQWANFIAGRLNAPQYNIKSILRNISYTTQSFVVEKKYGSDTRTSNTNVKNNNRIDRNISGVAPVPLHDEGQQRDSGRSSGRSSGSTINDMSSLSECVSSARGSILFLSPDSIGVHPFPFDVSLLHPRRSVVLFLGVHIEEVRSFFGERSDFVFKCRCCVIGEDEKSVCDAMVQIIEAYEDGGDSIVNENDDDGDDDDDIYHVPGCPRQLNKIDRVFPRELTEKDRTVYILLQRAAEDEVFVVVEDVRSRRIPLSCVCERLYQFTLPSDTSGQIVFKVECQSHVIGKETVQVLTNLDHLMVILKQEVSPLSILASALGLDFDDIDGVDMALAFKLQQLTPALTFQKMLPCEDDVIKCVKGDRSDVLYPSLLHFAADLNLRTFCSELLRYPGMISASLTENSQGECPSQIAARKGYMLLESDLLQFVEDLRKNDLSASTSQPSPHGRPKPHLSTGKPHTYINEQTPSFPASGLYIDMFNLKMDTNSAKDDQSQRSDTDVTSPLSEFSDNVFMRSISSRDGEDDDDEGSFLQASLEQDRSSSESRLNKALKMFGVQEEDVGRTRSSTVGMEQSRPETAAVCRQFASTIPRYSRCPEMNETLDLPGAHQNSNNDDSSQKVQQESKQRTLNKIVSFFGKIKNRRSNNEGDIIPVSSRAVKKSLSNRSDKSVRSANDSDSSSRKKKQTDTASQERDSGSYSDEEKDKSSASNNKKNSKTKEFRERAKPVTRRLSHRAHAASKECVRDAPELPSLSTRKEVFSDLNENF